MKKSSYLVCREELFNSDIVVAFDDKFYTVKPKVRDKDAIVVSQINFFSGNICERLIGKKIDKKLKKLLNMIDDDDDDDDSFFERCLVELEKFKLKFVKEYSSYFDEDYQDIIMKKCDLINDTIKYYVKRKEVIMTSDDVKKR